MPVHDKIAPISAKGLSLAVVGVGGCLSHFPNRYLVMEGILCQAVEMCKNTQLSKCSYLRVKVDKL